MRKRWRRCGSTARSELGFTFVEVLVALVIISAVGVAVAGSVSRVLRTIDRISDRLYESSRLLRVDDTVRALCARVRTPYYAASHDASVATDELTLGWLDGIAGQRLSLSFSDGVLTVGDGETLHRYTGFAAARMSLVDDGEVGASFVHLELGLQDSRAVTIVARLGGQPIVERTEP